MAQYIPRLPGALPTRQIFYFRGESLVQIILYFHGEPAARRILFF